MINLKQLFYIAAIVTVMLNAHISHAAKSALLSEERIFSEEFENQATLLKVSKYCGKLYVLSKSKAEYLQSGLSQNEFLSNGGTQEFKSRRKFPYLHKKKTEEKSFRTPNANIYLIHDELENWPKKEIKAYFDHLFVKQVQARVLSRFEDEVKAYEGIESEKISAHIKAMKDLIFDEKIKKSRKKLRLLFTLYPELIDEIVENKDDPLRPWICRFSLREHNLKILKRNATIFTVPTVGLGISSLIVGSLGMVLPPLAIAAGVSAWLIGCKDIGLGFRNIWHTEKASFVGERFKLIQKELKKSRKLLEQKRLEGPLESCEHALLEEIISIEGGLSAEAGKRIKILCRSKYFNRVLITFGLLNAGFNGVNFSGDPRLLANIPVDTLKAFGIL